MKSKLAVKENEKRKKKKYFALISLLLNDIHALQHTPEILPLHYAHVWESVWTGSEGIAAGLHRCEGEMSAFPGIFLCLAVPLDFYQCYSVFLRGQSRMELDSTRSYLKSSTPAAPTHTITPSSLACRTCSGACNRNTMSNAGENSQAKLSMSSPASGCEILDLTSSPLTKGHGGTGRGSGCAGYNKMGGEAA